MENKIVTIDLMGPVLSKIQAFLNEAPLEIPGLYRESHKVDLKQVSAIDFALAHDDGLNPGYRTCRAHEFSKICQTLYVKQDAIC